MTSIDPLNADFARKFPDEFASILGRAEASDIARVLKKLPRANAASIVARLPASRLGVLLTSGQQAPERWLADAPFNDAITLLSRIPREQSLALVNLLDNQERRRRLLQYLKYPAHSVGALVTDVPIRITANTPAADVLAELRALNGDKPQLLVVVQSDGRYLGLLDMWKLLTRHPPTGSIREYSLPAPALYPETSLASVIQERGWHAHIWLPVVDHGQRILGGVSRASVFSAATRHVGNLRPGHDLFSVLFGDMVHLLGELLNRLLTRRRLS